MKSPDVIKTVDALRERVANWRREGARVGLVPTMGALHAGHLSLVAEAKNRADRAIVSIFVNPAQFAPNEDFDCYPRNLDEDRSQLAAQGAADIVFAPAVDAFYPDEFATRIEMGGPALGLETDFRPHFFSGVATIVAKLLIATDPDVAVFGEKDYQQLLVLRRLVRDLGLAVEIAAAPIVREPDGLAMSSRNAYLGTRERMIAGKLNRVLAHVAELVRDGCSIPGTEEAGKAALLVAGFEPIDYVAVRDAETLAPLLLPTANMRALAAARIGSVRLIDNLSV